MSDDGDVVAFVSDASNLVPGDTNNKLDVFVWDRDAGVTARVPPSETGPILESQSPALSGDGRYVSFIGWDGVNTSVYLWDRQTQASTQVSLGYNAESDHYPDAPSISDDGRFVAYQVQPDGTGASGDAGLYVWDRLSDRVDRLEVHWPGDREVRRFYEPTISGDGQHVFFEAAINCSIAEIQNDQLCVGIWDVGTTAGRPAELVIKINYAGGPPYAYQEPSIVPSVSDDGQLVALRTNSPRLVAEDFSDDFDTFVWDRTTDAISIVGQTDLSGIVGPVISGDGRWLYGTKVDGARNYPSLWDLTEQEFVSIFDIAGEDLPVFSDVLPDTSLGTDDRFGAFSSDDALLPGDENRVSDIFIWDRLGTEEPPSDTDSDGDGLPDSWERANALDENGYPTYDLRAMGADPQRADIFLWVRTERSTALTVGARTALTQAFANAPHRNPDGTAGITLHIVDGPQLSPAQSDALRGDHGGPAWRKIWDDWLSIAPYGPSVFHLVLQVAWNDWVPAGQATLPGQMFVTNGCGNRSNWRKKCGAPVAEEATTLMHELGHNLGLRHGGGDHINWKPNYPSVMNYMFATNGVYGVPGIGLDYSRYGSDTFYSLDEGRLAERDGVQLKPGASLPPGFKSWRYCPGKPNTKRSIPRVNTAVDWNCKSGIQNGYILASINRNSAIEVLEPFDDWAHVVFADNLSNIGFSHMDYRAGDAILEY